MSSTKNKFGLSRNIPSEIKREIRKRDSFGCILCAFPIVEYEHVDPEFKDAKEHLVEGITILCPTCHTKVTNKLISKDLIKEAIKNPRAKVLSEVRDKLLFTRSHPTVTIGGAKFVRCDIPLLYRNMNLISITNEDGNFFLNALLFDSQGNQTLAIIDNEWIVKTEDIWDLEAIGNRVTIREKHRKPSLIFRIEENNNLIIEKIDMKIGRNILIANAEMLQLNYERMYSHNIEDCEIGFVLM
ncbi:HNH endonuclease [Acinetobacter baumannii]|uniref:HNH endonuclease n=1 Tax=Acinetobacter baumannii TaxID=470 RepID=UPI003A83A7C3